MFEEIKKLDRKRAKKAGGGKLYKEYHSMSDEELVEEQEFFYDRKIYLKAETKKVNQQINGIANEQARRRRRKVDG